MSSLASHTARASQRSVEPTLNSPWIAAQPAAPSAAGASRPLNAMGSAERSSSGDPQHPLFERAVSEQAASEQAAADHSSARAAVAQSAPSPQPRRPHTWATRLLSADQPLSSGEIARRAAIGLGLSALYGVALGARLGAGSLLQHALGVPLGLILVAMLGAPSVFVFLSICRAPIDARSIAGSVSRSVASAGILLAGLAPAAALFVVSSESAGAAAGMVVVGLLLGGGVALGRMLLDVMRQAAAGGAESVLGALVVAGGFGLFAIALASRVWGALLPILGSAT